MNNILIKPLITEKSMSEAANGRFTFMVDKDSNKSQIGTAVALAFNVKPVSVQTITVKGKTKRSGRKRTQIKTSDYKKAIITLEKGQKIDLFDVTEGEHTHA